MTTVEGDASPLLRTPKKSLRTTARKVHTQLRKAGCAAYVKTIYIGYELDGEMVAALYPHVESLELALAIPEDTPGAMLEDATHLTWRTMPLSARIRDEGQLDDAMALIALACDGVESGSHSVYRENEVFMKSKRDRDTGRSE